jgi:hypothetical protein
MIQFTFSRSDKMEYIEELLNEMPLPDLKTFSPAIFIEPLVLERYYEAMGFDFDDTEEKENDHQ